MPADTSYHHDTLGLHKVECAARKVGCSLVYASADAKTLVPSMGRTMEAVRRTRPLSWRKALWCFVSALGIGVGLVGAVVGFLTIWGLL